MDQRALCSLLQRQQQLLLGPRRAPSDFIAPSPESTFVETHHTFTLETRGLFILRDGEIRMRSGLEGHLISLPSTGETCTTSTLDSDTPVLSGEFDATPPILLQTLTSSSDLIK